jgi:hypothetical protein
VLELSTYVLCFVSCYQNNIFVCISGAGSIRTNANSAARPNIGAAQQAARPSQAPPQLTLPTGGVPLRKISNSKDEPDQSFMKPPDSGVSGYNCFYLTFAILFLINF